MLCTDKGFVLYCDLLLDNTRDYTAGCVLSGDPVYFQLLISSSAFAVEPAHMETLIFRKVVSKLSTLELELMFLFLLFRLFEDRDERETCSHLFYS